MLTNTSFNSLDRYAQLLAYDLHVIKCLTGDEIDQVIAKAKEIDIDEVKENIENKVEEIKAELEDLDKEKVLKIAKKKAKEIETKANELLNYAIEKGTPVLEKTASTVKEKTIEVTKQILAKLEKED